MKNVSGRRKGGLFWVGVVLLSGCSFLWLLVIPIVTMYPEDAVDLIAGMIALTAIPIGIGIYLIRRERKLSALEFRCTRCGFLNERGSELCKSCGAVLKLDGYRRESAAAATRRSGSFWVGVVLLLGCSFLWLLVILGIIIEPKGAGDAIIGTIYFTTIPIGIGIYLIRRERKLSSLEEFKCTLCGFLNERGSELCKSCGAVLKRDRDEGITIAIISGYILTISGAWLGIACAIYLLTKKQPRARYHGKILIVLMVVINVVWAVGLWDKMF